MSPDTHEKTIKNEGITHTHTLTHRRNLGYVSSLKTTQARRVWDLMIKQTQAVMCVSAVVSVSRDTSSLRDSAQLELEGAKVNRQHRTSCPVVWDRH